MKQPTKKIIIRKLQMRGLVNKHSDDCFRNIVLTISVNTDLGSWKDIIQRHMSRLLDEVEELK